MEKKKMNPQHQSSSLFFFSRVELSVPQMGNKIFPSAMNVDKFWDENTLGDHEEEDGALGWDFSIWDWIFLMRKERGLSRSYSPGKERALSR